jgi:hypothetical protein
VAVDRRKAVPVTDRVRPERRKLRRFSSIRGNHLWANLEAAAEIEKEKKSKIFYKMK